VYGNPFWSPVREDHPTVPVSPYGVGKLAAERYCAVFADLYGLNITALRLFSVYGPGQRKQVVWDLMNKIANNPHAIEIHGDGTQSRDFVYVGDVVTAALHVASRAGMAGEVYNIGSGVECTIDRMAHTLCELMDAQPRFDYTGVNRAGDPEQFVAEITRLGWLAQHRPSTTLKDGLAATVDWFRGQQ
jgi:UDP-glucose 4-epimerase